MPISRKYFADFNENCYYHVYNRTNNKERLFRTHDNYEYFLLKYDEYLSGYVDTLGWSLLPNHFHFEIRVKTELTIHEKIEHTPFHERSQTEKRYLESRCSTSQLIESAFKRFFQSYAQSFNKMFNRKGNLFYKGFKRLRLEFNEDIIRTLIYIHSNPVKHHLTKDFTTYPWSSWKTHVNSEKNGVSCCDVMRFFRNKDHFINLHCGILDDHDLDEYSIED